MEINKTRIGIPRGKTRQGFTLVELLVTIIIVLAAMVFVVTGKIRANAQQANAVSALRQIGIANVGCYTENNGAINVIRDSGQRLFAAAAAWRQTENHLLPSESQRRFQLPRWPR